MPGFARGRPCPSLLDIGGLPRISRSAFWRLKGGIKKEVGWIWSWIGTSYWRVIGSISDGSLFFTLPTRWLTGHAIIAFEG